MLISKPVGPHHCDKCSGSIKVWSGTRAPGALERHESRLTLDLLCLPRRYSTLDFLSFFIPPYLICRSFCFAILVDNDPNGRTSPPRGYDSSPASYTDFGTVRVGACRSVGWLLPAPRRFHSHAAHGDASLIYSLFPSSLQLLITQIYPKRNIHSGGVSSSTTKKSSAPQCGAAHSFCLLAKSQSSYPASGTCLSIDF